MSRRSDKAFVAAKTVAAARRRNGFRGPSNQEVAERLYRLAELLELGAANRFKVIAHRRAANTIATYPADVCALVHEGRDVAGLPHIGEVIAAHIREFCTTGRLSALAKAAAGLPADTVALSGVPGLGPKRLRLLREALGVTSVDDLRRAVRDGRLRTVSGFGPGFEARLRLLLERFSSPAPVRPGSAQR